jgi:hypothetical protein
MFRATLTLTVMLTVCCAARAQQHPDISGFWELRFGKSCQALIRSKIMTTRAIRRTVRATSAR